MPKPTVTEEEFNMVRPDYQRVKGPRPAFVGKPRGYSTPIRLTVSEVEKLNEYRRAHGLMETKVLEWRSDDAEFVALLAKNCELFEARFKEKVSSFLTGDN